MSLYIYEHFKEEMDGQIKAQAKMLVRMHAILVQSTS